MGGNLGNAFRPAAGRLIRCSALRAIAQQTGTLKSTPQQKVITATCSAAPAPAPATSTTASRSSSAVTSSAPAQVIKIESTNQMWCTCRPITLQLFTAPGLTPPIRRSTAAASGEQFTDSFVKGFGYSLGVATTYALFSSIDWDDDRHHIMTMTITITMMSSRRATRTTGGDNIINVTL